MRTPQQPSDAVSDLQLPRGLDDTSRRDIEEAQAAMRRLIALIPRNFGYADEIDFVFRPYHAQ
jgi:hypothetical protein